MSMVEVENSNLNEVRVKKPKLKFQLPHVIVMMLIMMLFACLLTYVVPAGNFEYTEDGKLIAGTYHSIEQTPVNPLKALTFIFDGGVKASAVIVLVLFMGGFFGAIFQLDSIGKVINYLIHRFEKAGPNMLVLGLFSLMSLIGFFIGGDMMIVFVVLGVILTKKLRLDPISALAVTFLPLFLAFSVAPTGEALIGQMFSNGVPLYSGYGGRTLMFLIYLVVTAAYVLFYTRRVVKDPTKSVMNNDNWLKDIDDFNTQVKVEKVEKVGWQDILVLLIVIVAPIVMAIGNTIYKWTTLYGNGVFIATFSLAFIACFLIKRKSSSDMINAFSKGVQDIVIVAIVIMLATTISIILQQGNILSTIVNLMTSSLSDLPLGVSSIFIFIAATLFNFLVPSGSGMSGVMLPILQPVADALGMTQQVLITSVQFGGGLGNLIIPTLGATMGAIALAKANFGSWLRFMMPLFAIWFVLGSIILYYIASIGWVGY